MANPTISFEFFPPKTPQGDAGLLETVKKLKVFNPKFMTVTFGAGGSTRAKTLETALAVQKAGDGIPTATHMTYINTPRKDIYEAADHLWENGIRHIVALRGDMPADLAWPLDPDAEYFQYTSHFVVALKARRDFEISVGAYPEKHPDAVDFKNDIEALKKKCLAGATRAITQFFFDNAHYYRFLEETAKAGISTPIIPGILPIGNYQKVLGFAQTCHASIPDSVKAKFENKKEEDHPKIAAEILLAQINDLRNQGVSHFHFYALNKHDLLSETLNNF